MNQRNIKQEKIWLKLKCNKKIYLFNTKNLLLVELFSKNQIMKKKALRQTIAVLDASQNTLSSDPVKFSTNIESIALNVIEKCNLSCSYCYADKGTYGRSSTMSYKTAISSINYLSRYKKKFHIKFFGGEPLLNFNLIQKVTKWCLNQKKEFSFSITTNGTLVKKSHIEFFKKNNFSLIVSYDGKFLQNQQRPPQKKSSWRKNNFQEIFNSDIFKSKSLVLRTTITPNYLNYFPQIIDELIFEKKINIYYSRSISKDKPERYNTKQIRQLEFFLFEFINKCFARKDFNSILLLKNISTIIHAINKRQRKEKFCSAGINYLSVSTDGSFYICHRFTEHCDATLGSVEHGINEKKIEKILNFREKPPKKCAVCWAKNLCSGGGCMHENKVSNNTFFEPDNLSCQLFRTECKVALIAYIQILKNAPQLLK